MCAAVAVSDMRSALACIMYCSVVLKVWWGPEGWVLSEAVHEAAVKMQGNPREFVEVCVRGV